MGVWRPQLGKWKNFPEREALLLFAQSLVELLFHHTADSFRARSLNLHSLVRECSRAVGDVVKGAASQGVLEPLLEELVHRIGNTSVFGANKPEYFSEYQAILGNKKKRSPQELALTLSALRSELETRYWPEICDAIKQEIASCQTSQRLIDLADTFIAEAELRGWDRQAIFSKTKWFFFTSRNEPASIDSVAVLDDFLSYFSSTEDRKFVCVFRATEDISEAQEVFDKTHIEVMDAAPAAVPTDDRSKKFLAENNSHPKYVFVRNIEARDGVAARKSAERSLQFIVNMYRFQRHDYHPRWSDSALVYDAESMQRYLIQKPNSPMLIGGAMRSALGGVSASQLTEVFMEGRLSGASASTLFSLLEYHRAALDSPTSENQLLGLWAGIEGMMPTPFGDKAHVLHFIDMLVPALSLTYVEKHVNYLVESFNSYDSAIMNHVRDKGVGGSDFEKCASVLCCTELAADRAHLLTLLDGSPLLKLRTEAVIAKLASPVSLKRVLDRRRLWICWQIQRIYATRNRIVHNARATPYLHSVVENLHMYFDTVVCAVIQFALSRGDVNTVGSVLQALRVHETAYLRSLESKVDFSVADFAPRLFGQDSPLNPLKAV